MTSGTAVNAGDVMDTLPSATSPTSVAQPAAHATLASWLDQHAEAIDTEQALAPEILPRLGAAGVFRIGVPARLGGTDGTIGDAIESIAQVAQHSLAAAFVFWGQRTFIEYLLQSPNEALRERWLDRLLTGELAGATGLSNAMKFLARIEPLQMKARAVDPQDGKQDIAREQWVLNGSLPWITNLRPGGFVVAAAFDHAGSDGGSAPDIAPSIFALPHDAPGVERSEDLDLIAMRSANTAALRVDGTILDDSYRITDDGPAWLSRVRPSFLGLQCGMSIGLARRSLAGASEVRPGSCAAIEDDAIRLRGELDGLTQRLTEGVLAGSFVARPAALFELRIALASIVEAAAGLEVQASGGRGYLRGQGGTARRSREAAFIPIITPSLVQLKNQLASHRKESAA